MPLHKRAELDTINPPGQIVNPIPESKLYKPTHGGYPEPERSRQFPASINHVQFDDCPKPEEKKECNGEGMEKVREIKEQPDGPKPHSAKMTAVGSSPGLPADWVLGLWLEQPSKNKEDGDT